MLRFKHNLLVLVLIHHAVDVLRRKPKVDYVKRSVLEYIPVHRVFREFGLMVRHQVVELEVVVNVAG